MKILLIFNDRKMSYLIKSTISTHDNWKKTNVFVCPSEEIQLPSKIEQVIDFVLSKNLDFFDDYYSDKSLFDKEQYITREEKIKAFRKVSSDTDRNFVSKPLPTSVEEVKEILNIVHSKWVWLVFLAEIDGVVSTDIEIYFQEDSDIFNIYSTGNTKDIIF